MYTPGERKCDLCQNTIGQGGKPYPVMFFPFTEAEVESLAARFTEMIGEAGTGSVLGQLGPIVVPTGARFEFCTGCAVGFIPMLDNLKNLALERIYARMTRRREKPDDKRQRSVWNEDEDG